MQAALVTGAELPVGYYSQTLSAALISPFILGLNTAFTADSGSLKINGQDYYS